MIKPRNFFQSVKHAFRGLRLVTVREQNFRLELLAASVLVLIIIVLPLDTWERILLILMAAAVLVLEILNTIFERISDILKPRLHPIVKEIKDMMAAAVLLTSFTAVVVAVMIFWTFFQSINI